MSNNILLRDVKVGDTIQKTRYGTKWRVEERKEPGRTFNGYITLRSLKGTFQSISSRNKNWDTLPVFKRWPASEEYER